MEETNRYFTAGAIVKWSFLLIIYFQAVSSFAQKDLPSPTSTVENIPAGTFIVPMDNDHQNIVPAGQGGFNLKAYGLINEFLQNGIPVKWAISSAKARDGIDFSATAERIAPSALPSAALEFRGGPFFVKDTVLPCGLSTREIIASFGNNVAVYQLNNSVSVGIRYTLTHRPKIAVFNNGGNQLIHTKILEAAGITDYDVMDAADIAKLKNCYTFASEPHADDNEVSMAVIEGIREFVLNGGNFLAQCHAVQTYENQGFFLTTSGITVVNAQVKHLYPNSDMAFAQVHGNSEENAGGSVDNFTLAPGSGWRSNTYKVITDISTDTVVALGAHLTGPGETGGNIFYLGGHDYAKGGGGKKGAVIDLSSLEKINALRMYLDVAFIPSGNSNGAWANAGMASDTVRCGQKVTLGCTPTGPPGSTFLWSPSAGLSCTTCENPVASPEVTTNYVVTVTNGCVARDTIKVVVAPKPSADFKAMVKCEGQIQFSDLSANADYWSWDFGDPASGTQNKSSSPNPSHTFLAPGKYTVTLIAGKFPACLDTFAQQINIPEMQLKTASTPTNCYGGKDGSASVIVPADIVVQSYLWNTLPPQTTPVATGLTAGEYTITMVPGNNCTYKALVKVGSPDSINSNATIVQPSCLLPGRASVEVSGGTSPYSYAWNTIPAQNNTTAEGLAPGNYELTVKDAQGCLYSKKVTILPPAIPVADFTFTKGCEGAEVSFKNISTLPGGQTTVAMSKSLWNFGDPSTGSVNTSEAAETSHLYMNDGIYQVQLITTAENGCSDTIEKPVPIYPAPDIAAQFKGNGCAPLCIDFNNSTSVTSGTIQQWSWNFGDPTSPQNTSTEKSPVHCFNGDGEYQVTLTAITEQGCTVTKTFNDFITVHPAPAVELKPEIKICIDDTTQALPVLDAGPGTKYVWHETGDTTRTILAHGLGKYSVTVFNQWGCITEASSTIKSICPPRLFVGNAFSPDKDGINDLFNVYSVHVGKFQMLVFNRWGEIIFESNDKFHFWDGIYRHEPMPVGVYEWIITYEGDCEEYLGPYKLEGSVTVVR